MGLNFHMETLVKACICNIILCSNQGRYGSISALTPNWDLVQDHNFIKSICKTQAQNCTWSNLGFPPTTSIIQTLSLVSSDNTDPLIVMFFSSLCVIHNLCYSWTLFKRGLWRQSMIYHLTDCISLPPFCKKGEIFLTKLHAHYFSW